MFVPLLWLANHRPGLCALIAAIAVAEWVADDAGRILARIRRPNVVNAEGVGAGTG